jgi:hypothetical protein
LKYFHDGPMIHQTAVNDATEQEAPTRQAGLPGKEADCFLIAHLIPLCQAGLAGCAPKL